MKNQTDKTGAKEEVPDMMPPNAPDVEAVVLGAILLEQEALEDALLTLTPEVFYSEANQTIFSAIKQLSDNHQSADIVTVTQMLKTMGRLEEIGGAYYITTLTSSVATSANLEYHIRVIKEKFIKRKTISICAYAAKQSYSEQYDVFETLNNLENNMSELNGHITGQDYVSDISAEAEQTYQYSLKPRNERRTGIATGNGTLTDLLGGWNKGELIILAARPGMGKTSRAIQFAIEAAFSHNNVAFFSVEMCKSEIHKKMFANVSGVDSTIIRDQAWNSKELEYYTNAKERIRQSGIFLCDKSNLNPNSLRCICRERKRKYGLDLVIIDYLQLMTPNSLSKSEEQNISSISKALKLLAKDLAVPIIALSQLSRECENRPSKKPVLSDLRYSGQIEQDADVVLSLYSPSYYIPFKNNRDYPELNLTEEGYNLISELKILKSRNSGGAGMEILEKFYKGRSLFQ